MDVVMPAAVLGARRRDNGGWFRNPKGTQERISGKAMLKQEAELVSLGKSAQSGDAFSLRRATRRV